MERSRLFLRTIEDLQASVSSEDPYEILQVSALVRKLFFDDYPLVDQVNREPRLPIRFTANETQIPPELCHGLVFLSAQDGLDPEIPSALGRRAVMNRDRFFGTGVLWVGEDEYSVRDLVLFEANVMGGVHAGSPREEKQRVLEELNRTLGVGGYTASLRQLKAIGRVVLRALQPLVEATRAGI